MTSSRNDDQVKFSGKRKRRRNFEDPRPASFPSPAAMFHEFDDRKKDVCLRAIIFVSQS